MKCKINANEINALKEKRVRLISEIELLRVGADLLSVKAEKLHDFLLSHTIEPTEKAFWREPERSDWTTKNGGKSQQEVLFVYRFICKLFEKEAEYCCVFE